MTKKGPLFEGKAIGVNVSLPASMLQAIRDLAERNNRPVSREMQQALVAHLEKDARMRRMAGRPQCG